MERISIHELNEFLIDQAQDQTAMIGCTAIIVPDGAVCDVDVRGAHRLQEIRMHLTHDVTERQFMRLSFPEFQSAESQGKYFHANIREQFTPLGHRV